MIACPLVPLTSLITLANGMLCLAVTWRTHFAALSACRVETLSTPDFAPARTSARVPTRHAKCVRHGRTSGDFLSKPDSTGFQPVVVEIEMVSGNGWLTRPPSIQDDRTILILAKPHSVPMIA